MVHIIVAAVCCCMDTLQLLGTRRAQSLWSSHKIIIFYFALCAFLAQIFAKKKVIEDFYEGKSVRLQKAKCCGFIIKN
jgi:hypothetical protein